MKLGIWLPIISRTPPNVGAPWELDGGAEDIAAVAVCAESAGFEYLFVAEHVALPVSKKDQRGEIYWDPFTTLGYVAARTRTATLLPLVLVAAYHHPLEVAKRIGTLDRLSNGRAAIGIGVGSLTEEFELLGAAMKERGRRADDMLRALHAARGERIPSYEGEFWRFKDMIVDPGLRADMPLWVGGLSANSVRRAASLGDVWSPTRMPIEQVRAALREADLKELLSQREKPLEVCYVMSEPAPLDALKNPQGVRDVLERLREAGVTAFAPELAKTTRELYCDQLRAMAEIAREY